MTLKDLFSGNNYVPQIGLYVIWTSEKIGESTGINAILMIYSERNGLVPFYDSHTYETHDWIDELPEHKINVMLIEEL